jgi:hypothetical protein
MRVLSTLEISAVSGGATNGLGFNAITQFFSNFFAAIVNLPLILIDPFYYFGSLAGG